ncbi:hypothetical protein [Alteromonas gilva]|uniref:Uncharacterized protein n=1 Tax=Alteromonas gilva TaxID=2987522 RepID=A0ABT5L2V0_9ALTE|nr:hypothetical protein [Alteromonas gilva]MDC8831378.1 hypothetical protein [Alteromonas gilva]
MSLQQTSELFLIIAAFSFVMAIFPAQYGAVYTGLNIAISGIIIFIVGLLISFPVKPDFNRALASTIGSLSFYFALIFLISFIGFCVKGSITFLSPSTFLNVFIFIASFVIAVFFKARGRVW